MDPQGLFHKGPRTAGNKSLVSFRAGYGITGYVGYIPSSEAIPIPSKGGPSNRAGPSESKDRAQPKWEPPPEVASSSIYQGTISSAGLASTSKKTAEAILAGSPGQTQKKGTHFVGDDAPIIDGRPGNPAFIATSVYNESYSPKKQVLSPASVRRSNKASFLNGTTYSGTHENSTEMMHGVGWLNDQKPKETAYQGQKFREVQVQRNPEETSYQSDFGEFGKGVPGVLSPQKEMLSASATTRKLFMGTAKAYNKMPGYQGFVPNSDRNQLAVSQSMNDHDRPDPKNHRLFNLKQYHVEIPGTMVFQPTDAANLMAASKGRMGTQTYYANAYISDPANQAIIAEKRAAQKQHGNTQATKTFFQWGKESVSENGVKNAEAYFKLVRPYEGLPRIMQPSMTAESGYMFGTYSERT